MSRLILPARLNSALVDNLLHDSTFKFVDNIMTTEKETLRDAINVSFQKAQKQLVVEDKNGTLTWGKHRETTVAHLLRLPQLSRLHLNTNGSGFSINATKEDHGPSWRMIVHLTDDIEAYGVYPGGQSGNPGSKYYDNFVNTWVKGDYNKLLFIAKEDIKDNKSIKWHLSFTKS